MPCLLSSLHAYCFVLESGSAIVCTHSVLENLYLQGYEHLLYLRLARFVTTANLERHTIPSFGLSGIHEVIDGELHILALLHA